MVQRIAVYKCCVLAVNAFYKRISMIKLIELPKRDKRLSLSELKERFGGCGGEGEACGDHSDCCSETCFISDYETAKRICD